MNIKKRILVVDDEPGILRFVRTCLSLAGYEVLTASDGNEALQMAKAEKPDLLLLDVFMVPISGFDVLVELRKFSQTPVIVFTARSSIVDRALKWGANDSIAKPFHPEEMLTKVKAILSDKA